MVHGLTLASYEYLYCWHLSCTTREKGNSVEIIAVII